MDNKSLFQSVLIKLNDRGVLDEMILIGSWALLIYRDYFHSDEIPVKRTMDIDFLLRNPPKITSEVKVPDLLGELGFDLHTNLTDGFSKFVHPDLEIEFLINQKGRGDEKIYNVKRLNITALPLRYLSLIEDNTIILEYIDLKLCVPEPTAYCLHKYLVSDERKNPLKKKKDLETANELSIYLMKNASQKLLLKTILFSIHPKWQKKILSVIAINNKELFEYLTY